MFRIGQKVVCVEAQGTKLIKDEIYKVAISGLCKCGERYVGVEGRPALYQTGSCECTCDRLIKNNGLALYSTYRFRPIDEAFGENIAAALEESFAFDLRTEFAS